MEIIIDTGEGEYGIKKDDIWVGNTIFLITPDYEYDSGA